MREAAEGIFQPELLMFRGANFAAQKADVRVVSEGRFRHFSIAFLIAGVLRTTYQ